MTYRQITHFRKDIKCLENYVIYLSKLDQKQLALKMEIFSYLVYSCITQTIKKYKRHFLNSCQRLKEIISDMPQESHLRPFLFLIGIFQSIHSLIPNEEHA